MDKKLLTKTSIIARSSELVYSDIDGEIVMIMTKIEESDKCLNCLRSKP